MEAGGWRSCLWEWEHVIALSAVRAPEFSPAGLYRVQIYPAHRYSQINVVALQMFSFSLAHT